MGWRSFHGSYGCWATALSLLQVGLLVDGRWRSGRRRVQLGPPPFSPRRSPWPWPLPLWCATRCGRTRAASAGRPGRGGGCWAGGCWPPSCPPRRPLHRSNCPRPCSWWSTTSATNVCLMSTTSANLCAVRWAAGRAEVACVGGEVQGGVRGVAACLLPLIAAPPRPAPSPPKQYTYVVVGVSLVASTLVLLTQVLPGRCPGVALVLSWVPLPPPRRRRRHPHACARHRQPHRIPPPPRRSFCRAAAGGAAAAAWRACWRCF